jgi:hypothetical protein
VRQAAAPLLLLLLLLFLLCCHLLLPVQPSHSIHKHCCLQLQLQQHEQQQQQQVPALPLPGHLTPWHHLLLPLLLLLPTYPAAAAAG